MAVQDVDLVLHLASVTEDVARVGVLSGEPQRSLFPTTADDDRDVLLHGPGVANCLGDTEHLAVKRRCSRSPHER